jgi:D-alanyl-D-alanine carboxypeptidase
LQHSLHSQSAAFPPPFSKRIHRFRAIVQMTAGILVCSFCMTFIPFASVTAQDESQVDPTDTGTVLLDPTGEGSPDISANAYVLYDAQSGVFLLGDNQDTPLPPASITKVMTVLLALEQLTLTDTIIITREMYESIPSDYQRLGLVEGEKITVEEAIYASLLISACDASMALAFAVGGSESKFADMMNDRAREIGCLNTNFTNPYGISSEDHLTTAHDMALIMAAALEIDTYRKISTTSDYTMPPTNKNAYSRDLVNGNRFVSTEKYSYEYYIGGKTGFTDLSAHTIAAGAQKNGRTLIGVILGAPNAEIRYANLISLFEYGFETYTTSSINPNDYTELQKTTIDQVNSSMAAAGYPYTISETSMVLDAYCTTTSARVAGGYLTYIDVSTAIIVPNQKVQVLELPVYILYADDTKIQVGVFSITISDTASAGNNLDGSNKEKLSTQTILLRAGIIGILLFVIITCIVLFIRMTLENKKRNERRNPRIL